MIKSQSLKLGALAQTLPVLIGYGANFIFTPFVVAKLGLSQFGIWSLTGAVAGYGVLLDLGIARSVMRYTAIHHEQKDGKQIRAITGVAVSAVLSVGLVLAAIALILSNFLGSVIGVDDMRIVHTLFFASISIIITGLLGGVFVGSAIGRGRVVAASLGQSAQRVSGVLGGVIALIASPGLESFAVGNALGGILGLVIIVAAIFLDEGRIYLGRPSADLAGELIRFGAKGQVFALSEIVQSQSGKIIAGLVLGPAAAGAYELGSRLAQGARALGGGASGILIAHFTRSYSANGLDDIRRNYPRLVQRNAATGIFAPLFLAATAFSLVPAWLGFANRDVSWAVIILSLAYAVNVSSGATGAVAMAVNRLGLQMVGAVLLTGLGVVLQLVLVRVAGLMGILIVMLAVSVLAVLIGTVIVHRQYSIPLVDFFRPLAGPFALGVASTLLALPAGLFIAPTDRGSAVFPFLLSGCLFVAPYLFFGWRLQYLPAVKIRRNPNPVT